MLSNTHIHSHSLTSNHARTDARNVGEEGLSAFIDVMKKSMTRTMKKVTFWGTPHPACARWVYSVCSFVRRELRPCGLEVNLTMCRRRVQALNRASRVATRASSKPFRRSNFGEELARLSESPSTAGGARTRVPVSSRAVCVCGGGDGLMAAVSLPLHPTDTSCFLRTNPLSPSFVRPVSLETTLVRKATMAGTH